MNSSVFAYALRRLLWVPPILFVVSFATFTLARFGPGDPVSIAAGQFRDPEVLERIRRSYGLDKPFYEQYWVYLKNLARGDLGESYSQRGRKVSEILFPRMWVSFQYNLIALAITVTGGIALGVYAARQQGTWLDPASIGFFLLLQSIPTLILVPFLLLLFALKLGVLPASGWPRDCGVELSFLGDRYDCIGVLSEEAVIPLVAYTIGGFAVWGRYTRAFVLGVLREDYVRTARAKGVSEFRVMTRHVLRNALLPLSTIIAFALVGLLEGSFFVETMTGIPGVGQLAFASIGSRDYDVIMAITMIGAASFVLMSILIDIVYTFIDPRVRYEARRGG